MSAIGRQKGFSGRIWNGLLQLCNEQSDRDLAFAEVRGLNPSVVGVGSILRGMDCYGLRNISRFMRSEQVLQGSRSSLSHEPRGCRLSLLVWLLITGWLTLSAATWSALQAAVPHSRRRRRSRAERSWRYLSAGAGQEPDPQHKRSRVCGRLGSRKLCRGRWPAAMGADAEYSCTESRTDSWSPDGARNPWSAPTTE